MNKRIRLAMLPLAISALLAVSPVMAQNTSAAISGHVVDSSGQPVANATVQIVHEPSGTTRVVTTDAKGNYKASGLRVGGPFDVTVSKDGSSTQKDNVYLKLAEITAVNVAMGASEQNAQELGAIQVQATAAGLVFQPDNKGLSINVSQQQLEATPSANRTIDDIVRLDPRINVTDPGDGSISAMGLPNRYNDISVDGVGVGDPFGLNANGLPYQNTPISPDTIAEYNISTTNFDVTSDSVGADINAVTKSGTNEFHGSVYYAYQNAGSMVGDAGFLDSSDPGYKYNGFDRNSTGGFTLGGPIVKDKLFFFVSAEQQKVTQIGADSANGLDPSLGDGPSTSNKVSPGDLQKIVDIASGYGLDTGGFGGSSGVSLNDKRYLAKLDWNISDNHRASLSWNHTKEDHPVLLGNSSDSVGVTTYRYTQAIKNDNISLQFFDDWSSNFSTEAKIGYQHFKQDTQTPIQAPQITVSVDGYGSPQVNLGEEQYRHYNKIDTKETNLYFAGTYYAGDHVIKGGIYAQRKKIYNLFGRTEFGAYSFDSIDQFASGDYYSFSLYQPAPGYTINDVAAQWTYTQYSPFIQDTWQVDDQLSVQYGLRINIPDANKKPLYNAAFEDAFGYANNNTLSPSNKVVEPRFGFNYQFDTERMTQLRGGFGLFQTSPPTVWMTNPYQNNGLTVATFKSYDPSSAPFSADPYNQPIPEGGGDIVGVVDTISPDFKLPTAYKFALAFDRELPWWGMIGSVEYAYIKAKDAIFYKAINVGDPTGTLPDGRAQFWSIPGANPRASGQHPYANANPDFAIDSTLLDNTNKGRAQSLTLALRKPFSDSWYGSLSATFNDTTEVNPGNSSQAYSGYKYVVRENPNQEYSTKATRNIARSIKASLTWQHAFFGDYKTRVSAFYSGHSGLPYTWIFTGDVNGDGISYEDPAYIPTMNDPLVQFVDYRGDPASNELIGQFQDFLSSDSYLSKHRGQIAGRNESHAPWNNSFDMSFSQEIPGLFDGAKGQIRLDIHNFLNLLNKDWGDVRYLQYDTRNLAGYQGVNADGQYIYQIPTDRSGNFQASPYETRDAGSNPTRVISRWSALLTVRYTF